MNLDLEAIRRRALALRNMIPGHDDGEDPYVLHVYEIEDADGCRPIEHDSHECDYFPLESRVYVADHCLMATVPTCEGALMHDTAEAIANVGADLLALLAEVERLRAPKEPPSNAHRFRVLLDVSPPLNEDGNRVGRVFDEARGAPRLPNGWRRSVAVIDALGPCPSPRSEGIEGEAGEWNAEDWREQFAELWGSIYGSWDSNAWVWVCRFKLISRDGAP